MNKKYPKKNIGYRLHLRRLKHTGKESIRTIKFPLGECLKKKNRKMVVSLGEKEKIFAQKVRSDYENLYGPLNFSSYMENKEAYSLKDFWVDCLRAGAVMMHTETKLFDTLRSMSGESKKIDKKICEAMKRKDKKFFNSIEFEKFKQEVLLNSGFRSGKQSLSFFRDDVNKSTKQKLVKDILQKTVEKSQSEQDNFWKKSYGADKTQYKVPESASTFYIFPEINLNEKLKPIDLLDRLEAFLQRKLGEDYRKIDEYVGVSDNQGGLSQIFNTVFENLARGNLDEIKESILAMGSNWKGKEKELDRRLQFLSKKAKLLENKIQLAPNWGEYRTDVGGKLASWVSNSFRQDDEIKKLLFGYEKENDKGLEDGHINDLEKLQTKFKEKDFIEGLRRAIDVERVDKDKFDEIKNIIEQMKTLLDKMPKLGDEEKIQVPDLEEYRNLLANLRSELNFFFQAVYQLDDEEDVKSKKAKEMQKKQASSQFKKLFKELPKIPAFLGDVKIKKDGVYDKYKDSVERMKVGIDFFTILQDLPLKRFNLNEPEEKTNTRIKQALNGFLQLYKVSRGIKDDKNKKRQTKNKKGERIPEFIPQILEPLLKKFSTKELSEIKEHDYFFRSPRSREKRGEDILNASNLSERVEKILDMTKIKWDKYKDLKYVDAWVGLVEIQKIRLGLRAYFYDFSLALKHIKKGNIMKHFPNIEIVLKRFKPTDQAKGKNIQTVIQQAIFSEMRGTAVKMTTKEFIARYVVQVMNAEKLYPLVTDLQKYGDKRKGGQRYYITSDKGKKASEDVAAVKRILKGKKIDDKALEAKDFEGETKTMFEIQTSKYQLQFLDNALSGHWSKYKPELSSYSFIYEETYTVTWTEKGPEIKKKEGSDKLFVAIPFKLNTESATNIEAIKKQKKFLGVDIGEYGVATYLLDTKNFKNPQASFIFEKAMRRIREGISENVKNQKAGTFSIPNTKVKRLRDNTINSIRNKIHRILVEENAWSVYEKEVSAFESGSGKISKVYHSIKQTDVYKKIAAEGLEAKKIWGDDKLVVGKDVSAYATSYICNHCHESIYMHIAPEDYNKKAVIKGKKIVITDPKGNTSDISFTITKECLEYIKNECNKEKDGSYSPKEIQLKIKKYTRPPIDVAIKRNNKLKEVINKFGGEKKFKKIAGNQSIYICPFCGKISDADIQAAMWIALKGYLNMFISSDEKISQHFDNKSIAKKWGGLEWNGKKYIEKDDINIKEKIQRLGEYAKEFSIPPIPFDIEKRKIDKKFHTES